MSQTTLPEDIFDVRKRERFLQEGLLTQDQVDAYLSSLEDCADNMETSAIQMVSHGRVRGNISFEDGGPEEDES
jgi:hypothetical protein